MNLIFKTFGSSGTQCIAFTCPVFCIHLWQYALCEQHNKCWTRTQRNYKNSLENTICCRKWKMISFYVRAFSVYFSLLVATLFESDQFYGTQKPQKIDEFKMCECNSSRRATNSNRRKRITHEVLHFLEKYCDASIAAVYTVMGSSSCTLYCATIFCIHNDDKFTIQFMWWIMQRVLHANNLNWPERSPTKPTEEEERRREHVLYFICTCSTQHSLRYQRCISIIIHATNAVPKWEKT